MVVFIRVEKLLVEILVEKNTKVVIEVVLGKLILKIEEMHKDKVLIDFRIVQSSSRLEYLERRLKNDKSSNILEFIYY